MTRSTLLYAALFALAACDDGAEVSEVLLPHEACEEIEGLAPCCDPPTLEETAASCPPGTEWVPNPGGGRCRWASDDEFDGVNMGPFFTWGFNDDLEIVGVRGYGSWGEAGVSIRCSVDTGRMLARGGWRHDSDLPEGHPNPYTQSCVTDCWDETGSLMQCESVPGCG